MNTTKYFAPDDQCYTQGFNLDIRARIAQALITTVMQSDALATLAGGDMELKHSTTPASIVRTCCDVAERLVDEFSERGWVRSGISQAELAQSNVQFTTLMDHYKQVKEGITNVAVMMPQEPA